MTTHLPGSPTPTLFRLLDALRDGDTRDRRIATLALSHLANLHRQFLLPEAERENHATDQELAGPNHNVFEALRAASFQAMKISLWKLGLTNGAGRGRKALPPHDVTLAVLENQHLGGDPDRTEFACPECGNRVQVPVGKHGDFSCPSCSGAITLRVNNGRRVAFKAQNPEPTSAATVALCP